MDYTKRFLSFLIDEIIFSVMSIVLMLILSHIGILTLIPQHYYKYNFLST